MQKKYTIGPQLRPIISEKRKLREVVMKRGKVLLYPYFHPPTPQALELWGCWLNELLLWSFSFVGKTWFLCFESDCGLLYWVLGDFSDWFLVNRKFFEPQGVKQVVIFRFDFLWIKGRLTFIIINEKAWLKSHLLPIFSCFRPLGGSPKWGLAAGVGQWGPTMFKGKIWLGQKLCATVSQRIKACLGWKFQVQDLRHEPKVLPMFLAHSVARMCWVHAKGMKKTD